MEKVCLNKGWLFKRVNDSEEKLINIPHDAMIYEIENSNTAVCFAQSNGTNLTLRSESAGYTTILVRAINQDGLSVSCRFRVDVKP